MKYDIYVLRFNNYSNRIAKRYQTIDRYVNSNDVVPIALATGVDGFNRGNEIVTTYTIKFNLNTEILPDYVVLTQENGSIDSRWFIMDIVYLRSNQYRLSLYRDVISDWWNEIIEAKVFVEKAMLPISDYGIFNSENMTYNQIKRAETLLKDKTGTAWIVGYIARNTPNTTITIPNDDVSVDYEYQLTEGSSPLSILKNSYPYANYTEANPMLVDRYEEIAYRFNLQTNMQAISGVLGYQIAFNELGNSVQPLASQTYIDEYLWKTNMLSTSFKIDSVSEKKYGITNIAKIYGSYVKKNSWDEYTPSQISSRNSSNFKTLSDEALIKSEDGKVIKIGSFYYKIKIVQTRKLIIENINPNSTVGLKFKSVIESAHQGYTYMPAYNASDAVSAYGADMYITAFYTDIEPIQVESLDINIGASRPHPDDMPYDIFCMPYGELEFGDKKTNAYMALKLAQSMIISLGSYLYDIQILPYCPLDLNKFDAGKINSGMFAPSDLIMVEGKDTNTIIGWVRQTVFTSYINKSISVPSDPIAFKVMNEISFQRLVSPNYNGTFEFKATMNKGVSRFRCDCTYRPFTPYIRVAPQFKSLYGYVQDDSRGLICNGDFSLTQVSDAWIQYQINNKNFQSMFDRQITNMNVNNSIQRGREISQAVTGTLTAAASGFMTGSLSGAGAIGGAVGAGVFGIASALGGAQDIWYAEQARKEAIDFTKDQFGYTLGNIQALPNSLTKISSINANNKIFPILEWYEATEMEKNAIKEKIIFNGMTVMRIGSIIDFIGSPGVDSTQYIKCQLIRETQISAPYMILHTISNELNKGVYVNVDTI